MKKNIRKLFFDFTFLILGCIMLSVSINVFLLPNKISAGGISTIGTVLFHLFGIKMSITNLIFNVILFALGYKYLGKYAIIQTVAGIVLLSACLEFTSHIPVYSHNDLISILSGGVLMGVGVGMIVKTGASTGGSDFAGLILKNFFPHISLARLIMVIDFLIVVISGVVFKNYTVTVYSIIALFVSSEITDKIIVFGDEAKLIQVFSKKASEISDYILSKYERGVTGIPCIGMYSSENSLMLLCAVTPKELPSYMNLIKNIDRDAFIIISNVNEVIGEGFKTDILSH